MDAETKAILDQNHREVLAALDKTCPTVIFTAGGTSGHINPALAVASELRAERPDLQIVFAAREVGMETELIPRAGFPLYYVESVPFEFARPRIFLAAITAYFRGQKQALEMMRQLNVRAVVGTGGYVSAPVVSAGKKLGIPRILHEQNAYPGKSTRSMSKGASAVCVSFENTIEYFPKAQKVVLTGNPIATHFFEDRRDEARERLGIGPKQRYVLATGGSLGAVTLNQAILDLNERLKLHPSSTPYTTHLITGKKRFQEVRQQVNKQDPLLKVSDYVYDMPDQLAAADIVICRAGAGTCSELAAMGKPSILVPYPYAKGDHQTKNAQAMVDRGAAMLIPDQDLKGIELKHLLDELFLNEAKLQAMGEQARSLAQPDASSKIVREILEAMA